jgi:chromosome segregation ATPase
MEEVMKIQMMKKEEEVENLEEEVVTLRVKIVKLNKNIEERETSTSSVNKVEEKYSRFPERKNEEKSYAEVLKGRNHGQQESNKNEYNRDTSSTRPSTFR